MSEIETAGRRKIPADSEGSSPNRPVAVDLFSGAGGLSLGFEQAGFDVLAAVEYDPIHAAVHEFNFPRTTVVCADIATVTAERLQEASRRGWDAHGRRGPWHGQIDAVIGGPPCQGFSTIGKRKFDDVRNQLVFHFARLVEELRPRYFVMENVPGMASLAASAEADAPMLLELLVAEFESAGYQVRPPQTLNASSWGVPQDRKRLILVGNRIGEELIAYPEPTTKPRPRRPTAQALRRFDAHDDRCPTVRDAIGDLPNLDDYRELIFGDEAALRPRDLKAIKETASPYARVLRGDETDLHDFSWPRAWDREVLTSSCRTIHSATVVARFDATETGRPESVSRLFRLHPDGISSTLRAGTHYERGSFNAPRPIHYAIPRVISGREAARLHSFPDWFRLHWTKWHGFRQVGNALPPLVGRAMARQIIIALGVKPARPASAIELGDPQLLAFENLEAAAHFGADTERMPRNALRHRKVAGNRRRLPSGLPDAEAA